MNFFKKSIVQSFVLVAILIAVLAGCADSSNQNGQDAGANSQSDYPQKTITWIVPFSPGGNSDAIVRSAVPFLKKYLPNDVDVVVENKDGAGGTIGLTALSSADADGYTIGQTAAGPIAIQPNYSTTSYAYDDFDTIANMASVAQFLTVPKDAPYQTFEEWVDYVKENPGFKVGVTGAGNMQQMAMAQFADEIGIELEFVVYKGAGPIVTALLGGNVQSGVLAHPLVINNQGDMNPLVNVTSVKPEELSDIPTFADKGYSSEGVFFNGVIAPKGLPDDVRDTLAQAFKEVVQDEEFKTKMDELGQIIDYKAPEEYQELITKTYNSSGEVLESLGLLK
ncbi:Bug family tripartite tricarboxylate transporter substrate binding protein [Radiobacillus sp. PE A8.2]|uniref:Bug family tripartite tricarboxylate transporter substrate binding protein n=1 Tax=Radiobacillus sp. PE A8.2 TaxID=3380349 RepID=UPI00388DBE97